MSELLTPDEQISALVKMGVPRERAEKVARADAAWSAHIEHHRAIVHEIDRALGVKFIRLPWSALLPDNRKTGGVIRGRIINSREYRATKKKARDAAIEQIGTAPFKGPVRFEARLWTPNPRTRDIANYSKLVNDALKGVAYVDDGQIDDNRWVRAGTDIDAPRAEITVTLILP